MQKLGKRVHLVGYVVTTKDTRTIDNKPMHFGTFYDRVGEVFDTVHFPNIAIRYPFRGRGFYSIRGKVVEDFGVSMIEVDFMEKLPMINPRTKANVHLPSPEGAEDHSTGRSPVPEPKPKQSPEGAK